MFGFKRKEKNDEETGLITKKKGFFAKIAAFFRKNKDEYYSNEAFYSTHSTISEGIDNEGDKIYDATINLSNQDSYEFAHMKEMGLFQGDDGEDTKLVVADLKKINNDKENLRKVCFEIPANFTLEEFLYNDGLFNFVNDEKFNFQDLDYYQVTPIGRAIVVPSLDFSVKMGIGENSTVAKSYAKNILSKEWQKNMKVDKKAEEESKKQDDIDKMFNSPEASKAFDSDEKKLEDRINDNNIRVAPGTESFYFTDPDDGKTIVLENLTKVNSVEHKDGKLSNLYVVDYSTRGDLTNKESQSRKQKLAFELSDKSMEDLLKNKSESLNFAFRTFFSETNVSQYIGAKNLKDRHIGYLKETEEGYKIIYGSQVAKEFLGKLELDKDKTSDEGFRDGP